MPVLLFPSEWSLRYFNDRNDGVALHATPPSKDRTKAEI